MADDEEVAQVFDDVYGHEAAEEQRAARTARDLAHEQTSGFNEDEMNFWRDTFFQLVDRNDGKPVRSMEMGDDPVEAAGYAAVEQGNAEGVWFKDNAEEFAHEMMDYVTRGDLSLSEGMTVYQQVMGNAGEAMNQDVPGVDVTEVADTEAVQSYLGEVADEVDGTEAYTPTEAAVHGFVSIKKGEALDSYEENMNLLDADRDDFKDAYDQIWDSGYAGQQATQDAKIFAGLERQLSGE